MTDQGRRPLQRILAIDDEPDIRDIVELALGAVGGLGVETAPDGPTGIAAAIASPPDLILVDMMMPGMDGLAVLDRLRADPGTAAVPVAFMTAKVQPGEVRDYLERGAAGVIAKPFDPMTLADEVHRIWAGDG